MCSLPLSPPLGARRNGDDADHEAEYGQPRVEVVLVPLLPQGHPIAARLLVPVTMVLPLPQLHVATFAIDRMPDR